MRGEQKSLELWRTEMIEDAQKGYTMPLAGAVYFFVVGVLSFYLQPTTLSFIWIVGMGSVFPLGILFSKSLGVNLMAKGNPLGTLGGIVGGTQAFFIPVYIVAMTVAPDWLPVTIGILGGSHFLPYVWIYDSPTYLFIAVGMGLVSLGIGVFYLEGSYQLLPFLLMGIYLIGVLGLRMEQRRFHHRNL